MESLTQKVKRRVREKDPGITSDHVHSLLHPRQKDQANPERNGQSLPLDELFFRQRVHLRTVQDIRRSIEVDCHGGTYREAEGKSGEVVLGAEVLLRHFYLAKDQLLDRDPLRKKRAILIDQDAFL